MMFVAEFVQRLHPYFKHYKENNAKKSFMQHLLRKCYNLNEKEISEPSALRFYNGIVEDGIIIGDNICSFAANHINLFDVKSASDFIAECTKDIFNKDALCAEFSDVIPDIDINNYPAKLASQLKTLLENAANTNIEETKEAKRSAGSRSITNSVRMLETDRTEIAGIIDRLTKILDRMFAIAITADLWQLDHSTELVDFLSSASREQFATYNESHVLQFHQCDLASWKANRAKSKGNESQASESKDIPNTAKEIENDVTIDQVFQCSEEVIDENTPEWLKEIEQNLEELMSENQKLSLFCTRYPQYEALTKLYKKAFTLWPKMFCRDLASDIEKPYSKDVNEYIELLESCSQSIVLNNPFVQNTP